MAKVTITVNTEDKSIAVDMNGKTVDNVDSVSIYKYEYKDEDGEMEQYIGCSVSSGKKDGDVEERRYYSCSANEIVETDKEHKPMNTEADNSKNHIRDSIMQLLFPGRV